MPTLKVVKERFRGLRGQHVAVAVWTEYDVLNRAEERKIKFTRAQAREIIDNIDRKQDCELGISWTTIDCGIDDLVQR